MLPTKERRNFLPDLTGLPRGVPPIKPNLNPTHLIRPLIRTSLNPASCWEGYKNDGTSFADVYFRYVFVLSAIAPVSNLIGTTVFGDAEAFEALIFSSLLYLGSLVLVYLAAQMGCYSAAMLGAKIDLSSSGKLVVYSLMPYFICGIFLIHPSFSAFTLCGSYSFFLFYRGAEVMSDVRPDARVFYWMINVVPWIWIADAVLRVMR